MAPNFHERSPVALVGGFEGGKIRGAIRLGLRGEDDAGEIEATEQFEQKEADGAAVKIAKRMHGEEASLRKSQKLQREVRQSGGRFGPPGREIGGIAAHLLRDEVGRRGLEPADGDFDDAPASGPLRHQIAAEAGVEIEEEVYVERAGGEMAPE